jgi:hypothetical protein
MGWPYRLLVATFTLELSNMLGTQKSGPIAGADNSKEAIGGTQDRTLQELRSLNQQQSKGREQPKKRIKSMCGLFAWIEEIAFARPKPGLAAGFL